MLPSGERAKNARTISLPSLQQHYLVAMTTSVEKVENKGQIHHKALSCGEKIAKIGPEHPEIFDEKRRSTTEHATQFPLGCSLPKLLNRSSPKILHDIVALESLLNHAYTRR